MSGDDAPDIGHEDFWYIPLNGDSSKLPSVKWGGYGQDFEAADEVYSHDQVVEYDHEHWGIVGIKGDGRSLLMFDIDIHKSPEDFDADLVTIPTEETLVVKSQNGGFHVWFVVDRGRGGGQESDFAMTYNLGFDIDIRGSYVKHHGVAPRDIPGVKGKYEVAQMGAEPPMTVFGPADATDRIRYLGDDSSEKDYGEALLEHTGGRSAGGTGNVSIDIDRGVEPPEEMPTCYHRALQLRAANPDDPNVNTHKVNVLAGLCGLAAGYDVETMVGHFVDDYAPGNNADREETEYQLSHLARKMDGGEYAPPAISTLREYGVLNEDEVCRCSIEYHGNEGAGDSSSPPPAVEDGNEGIEQNTDELWGYVRSCYQSDDDEWSGDRRKGRLYAAKTLEKTGSYMYTLESEQLWVYEEATGTFSPWGEQSIDRTLESRLGKFYSNSEKNEIVNRIKARNQTRREELNGGLHPSPLLSVGNGVVDLETGELHDHDPDHKFTRGLEWDYDPENADKGAILEFLDDVTKREEDRDTVLDHLATG